MRYSGLNAVVPILGIVFSIQSDLHAHDLWLIPPENGQPNSNTVVRANSGIEFPKSEHAPDTSKFKRRLLILPDGSVGKLNSAGTESNSGLLKFEANAPGRYIVAVETEPKFITLEAEEFNHYLMEDGLPHIYAIRRKEAALNKAGRERYSKSPKAILQIGAAGGGDPCRVVGLPLEIVPTRNPFELRIGDALRVRVLFHGNPLADAYLGWDLPDKGDQHYGTARTDDKGEALIPIDQTGLLTIRLTHMIRSKAADYDWESFWTTLTFHVPKNEPNAECLARVRDVHGGAGPWAVAGYRIGQRALKELGLPRQSFALSVTFHSCLYVLRTFSATTTVCVTASVPSGNSSR
jgi:uncharacterized GH25 family protein